MVFIPPLITKKPALGAVPKDAPKETAKFLRTLKEVLEVGEGKRGDSMDRYLTLRHLRDAGLVESLSNGSIVAVPSAPSLNDISQYPGYTTEIPEAPSNVTVTGGFSYVFVKWDVPSDNTNIGHAEVWRSETDSLGTATLAGTSPSTFYVDEVGTGSVTYFYWVRFVSKWSTIDVPIYGPYNAVSGTSGATVLDPSYVLEVLEGQITSSQLNETLNTSIGQIPLNKIAIEDEVDIRETETGQLYGSWTLKTQYESSNGTTYVSGFGTSLEIINGNPVSNFIVKADNFAVGRPGSNDFYLTAGTVNGVPTVGIGSAHIHDLAVTNAAIQNLAADKIYAASGTLAQAFIGTGQIENAMIGNVIQSNPYIPDSTGWIINKNGYAEFQNAKITGNIRANSLDVNAANIVNTLNLQNQAVTFPAQSFRPQQVDYPQNKYDAKTVTYNPTDYPGFSTSFHYGWKDVISLNSFYTGSPVFVHFSFAFKFDSSAVFNNYTWSEVFEFRVIRDNTHVVREFTALGIRKASEPISGIWENVAFALGETTPSGWHEYKIQVRYVELKPEISGSFSATTPILRTRYMSIMTLETKR